MQQTVAKAGSDRIDRGTESLKVAFRFHPNDTLAVRAAVTTQKKAFVKTVKKCRNKPMSPNTDRTAPGATLRFLPVKISPLPINFVEKN